MKRSRSGGATGSQTGADSQVRMKQDNNGDSNATHSHTVYVKFSASDKTEFTMTCKQPCTVLELLKSSGKYNHMWSDENIVIQVGKTAKKHIIATHFPCTCIHDGIRLTVSCKKQKVEEAKGQHEKPILSRDRYSVFYLETVGGKNTKTKKLFKNNDVKDFTYLCVYGEKGTTVKEAVERDGRFIDDLGDFTLSHNEKSDRDTECSQPVDDLNRRAFKLCLPLKRGVCDRKLQEKRGESNTSKPKAKTPQRNSGASNTLKEKCNTTPPPAVVHQRGISVRTAMQKPDGPVDLQEIYEILCKQCRGLKEWMESRFPGDSYQKALNLKKEDFGKIQQSFFNEFHRVREIVQLGESVCKVIVEGYSEGTGFVLFDNYILTNAHLFEDCTEGQKVRQGVNVSVLFNYEKPEPFTKYNVFQVAGSFICLIEGELDYAVLEIIPNKETKEMTVPPGLLKTVGPIPPNGEACIIGHPGGEVKQMDPTCIIEKENRGQAVDAHLHPYRDTQFFIHVINCLKEQGIDQIMMGGNRAEKVATYNTFMYHRSSGSPVFDVHGKVFGLHTRGYVYGFPKEESVIEFAQPLLTILKHFVDVLKKSGDENMLKLLKRLEEEAKGNSDIEKLFEAVGIKVEPDDPEEILDSSEPMEVDKEAPCVKTYLAS